ncbi:MAG: type II TA system antitoxin MqsA family protein [Acidobacteriota bacterium]
MNTPKEMDCFECGNGSLIPKMVEITGYRHGEEFTVLVNGLQCTACGLKTIDNEYSGEFTKLVSDAYREKHGLLTGTRIREARNRLGMSQDKFAQYLKVGPASVNRWENGKIQDEAMNELILVKTDLLTAISNYQIVNQSATMGSGIAATVFCDEAVDVFAPFAETQFRKQKSAFAVEAFPVTEVYAPSC